MRILQKASRFLFKALEWFAIICMVVLTVIVFTDVILRYIFKQGFPWTQEVATLMLVWFSLSAWPSVFWKESTSALKCLRLNCPRRSFGCWKALTIF